MGKGIHHKQLSDGTLVSEALVEQIGDIRVRKRIDVYIYMHVSRSMIVSANWHSFIHSFGSF